MPNESDNRRSFNALDLTALVVGLAALVIALAVLLQNPLDSWKLRSASPTDVTVVIRVAASEGFAPLLPLLEGRSYETLADRARVIAIDIENGSAEFEVTAHQEPDDRLRLGSVWLRPGASYRFQHPEVLFVGVVLSVERPP